MTTVAKLEPLGGKVSQLEFLVGGNETGSGAMGIPGRNLLTARSAA